MFKLSKMHVISYFLTVPKRFYLYVLYILHFFIFSWSPSFSLTQWYAQGTSMICIILCGDGYRTIHCTLFPLPVLHVNNPCVWFKTAWWSFLNIKNKQFCLLFMKFFKSKCNIFVGNLSFHEIWKTADEMPR